MKMCSVLPRSPFGSGRVGFDKMVSEFMLGGSSSRKASVHVSVCESFGLRVDYVEVMMVDKESLDL